MGGASHVSPKAAWLGGWSAPRIPKSYLAGWVVWFLVFGFLFTILLALWWAPFYRQRPGLRATVLSAFIGTVRFRSIRLRECTTNNTYKNGINIRTYPAMQPQAAKFEASAALAGADSRSLALLTLRVSFRLPHLSITPTGLMHFMGQHSLLKCLIKTSQRTEIESERYEFNLAGCLDFYVIANFALSQLITQQLCVQFQATSKSHR